MTLPLLTPVEARILGVLIEKSKTTPDAYPLTLNSLVAGCNQKTSRAPVMSLSDSELLSALEELRHRILVMESYGGSGRVLHYAHNFGKVYDLPAAAVNLLAVLMLRGPQTASELRANCERLQHFADASAVEGYLDELANRESGALTVLLPRQPGSREPRWCHLLCGEPIIEAMPAPTLNNSAELEIRVTQLEAKVAELEAALSRLEAERDV
jgi:uncharacterized protein YceH (UPF0502 family)